MSARWIAAGIFAVALAVRLAFLHASPDRGWPHSIRYEGDAPLWARWAAALERGETFGLGLPLWAPGIAYLLRWLPGSAASPFVAAKALWCVFSAATCALAFLGFRGAFGLRVALLAAALSVFSFGSYVTATTLADDVPYGCLVFSIVLAALLAAERPRLGLAILLGLLHGVAMLVRPEHPLTLALLAGFLFRTHEPGVSWRRRGAMVAVMVVVAIIVCLPWNVRGARAIARFNEVAASEPDFDRAKPAWTAEARAMIERLPAFARRGNFLFISARAHASGASLVTKEFVQGYFRDRFRHPPEPFSTSFWVSMKGPLDFALANHPEGDGGFGKRALAQPGESDSDLHLGRPDHARLVNAGYAEGWAMIAEDPRGWLGLVRRKLAIFADGLALGFTARNLPIGDGGVRRPVDLMVAERAGMWKGVVLVLICVGVAVAWQRGGGTVWLLLAFAKVIVTILFYGYARSAVAILPAFFLFVALALDTVLARVARLASPAATRAAGAILVALALAIDCEAALRPARLEIVAPNAMALRATPEWGFDAFESAARLELRAIARSFGADADL